MTDAGITKTGTILDKIVARKIEEVAQFPSMGNFVRATPGRNFIRAIRQETVALIAEIKHASPSKGILIENFDPVALGSLYDIHGASAISVLTDRDFFQGSLDDLRAVRQQVSIPVLRKDFIIDEVQIREAWAAGADAILLIVAILDDSLLQYLFEHARRLHLTPLIEVHTEGEMERALKLNPPLIGINNRDLHSFKVDLEVSRRLAKMAPPEITLVAESGIFTIKDVESMAAVGVDAILVGESIVKAPDVGAQVRALSSVKRQARSS
jgi:indole-3-glycerol phosphate synthase